jgi:hypothetical protein
VFDVAFNSLQVILICLFIAKAANGAVICIKSDLSFPVAWQTKSGAFLFYNLL